MRKMMLAAALVLFALPVSAQTIVEEWSSVKAPPAPALKEVTVDPRTTAFLLLDFVNQTCNEQRRPRCIASMPKVLKAAEAARARGVAVVHSTVRGAKPEDVKPGFAPKPGEPVVQTVADKFLGTELEKTLKDKGIQTVIVTGTAAHGAVLYTTSGAVYRGFKAIVPVDGMSSESTFFEQYVAFQLLNLPGAQPGAVTLTKLDLIKY